MEESPPGNGSEVIRQLVADALDAVAVLPELKARVRAAGDNFYNDARTVAIEKLIVLLRAVVKGGA